MPNAEKTINNSNVMKKNREKSRLILSLLLDETVAVIILNIENRNMKSKSNKEPFFLDVL
jgi:hypothetical protein